MANENADSGIFNSTIPTLMAFPHLLVPQPFKARGTEKGEPKYGASFVLEPNSPDLESLKKLFVRAAKAAKPDLTDFSKLSKPWKSGDKLADRRKAQLGDKYAGDAEYQRGKVVLTARSKYAPVLSVIKDRQHIELADDALRAKYKDMFFFGAEVLFQVNFRWFDGIRDNDPDGITAYLNMVLATGKGKRLGNSRSSADAFKGYVGALVNEDPTEGLDTGSVDLDDNIPF